MGCMSSAPKKRVDPVPKVRDQFWLEPVNNDSRIQLRDNGQVAVGAEKGGRVYVAHKNTPGKTTRYWFKANPGLN